MSTPRYGSDVSEACRSLLGSRSRFWKTTDIAVPTSTAQHLFADLVERGELSHIRKGLYWRGALTRYGMTPPSTLELVEQLVGTAGIGPAGFSAANALNLSTQVPWRAEYAVPARPPSDSPTLRFVNRSTRRGRVDHALSPEDITALEVLDGWTRLIETPPVEAMDRLADMIGSGRLNAIRIAAAGATEPGGVRSRLRYLLRHAGHPELAAKVHPADPRTEARALTGLASASPLADSRDCAPPRRVSGGGLVVYRLRPSWHPRYQSDVYVPSDLRHLDGPTRGRFDPPVNLYWQPGELDFADRGDIELFYSSVLPVASTAEQFEQWVNGRVLASVWSRLSLPSRVRGAWETIHPHLRSEDAEVNDRIRIQDTILTAIAEQGFALAGGSALIDYDIVTRESEDIDAFNDRWDVAAFNAAHEKVLAACRENGWDAKTVHREELDRKIHVDAGTGTPVVVQLVYYGRSRDPERRATGGLRLVFDDVVGGKGAAVADVARGRDFDDLAHILETPGWSLARVEDAMRAIKYADQIEKFRTNIARFRRGEFDDDIRKSGFDPAFSHRVLD